MKFLSSGTVFVSKSALQLPMFNTALRLVTTSLESELTKIFFGVEDQKL